MTLIKSISGIRGTIGGKEGEALTPNDVVKYVSAYGQWIKENSDSNKVVIGRDARPSGSLISDIASSVLQSIGFDVVDLGLSTTPTVEIAVAAENAGGGIIITASHNPNGWNALKLLNVKGEFISSEEGQRLLELAELSDVEYAASKNLGKRIVNDTYIDYHIDKILALDLVDQEAIRNANLKIAVDTVNSTGSIAIPKLLDKLGVNNYKIFFDELSGIFPHNPEPLPENITHICNEVESGRYDLGIVVDPDVDRLAFVADNGEPFGEEYTLVVVADYVLKNTSGNTVSNMSSSRALKDVTLKNGGSYEASAVGEVNVVNKMRATNAIIGGEGNGGVIYPELHYGRDALVGIALFLSSLAKFGKSSSFLRSKYPNYHISKNKIDLTDNIDVDEVLIQIQNKYKKQPINTEDGVKIEFDNEWVHLRKSNTEPIIRIYSESESQNTAEVLAKKIMMDISDIVTEKV